MPTRRDLIRVAAATAATVTAGATVTGCDPAGSRATPLLAPSPSAPGPASASASGGSPPVLPPEVVHGPRDRPRVALTFHGQGDPVVVKQLLKVLTGTPVTVLAVGSWLAAYPQMARLILDGGHELGNHTQHHLAMATMSADQARAEIAACARQLRELTGSIGRWFRPSQIRHSTDLIRAQADAVGYPTCLSYDLDALDYTDPPAGAITRTVLSEVGNGSIVSLHFGHAGTVTAMPHILDGLRERGLTPVTMTALLTP